MVSRVPYPHVVNQVFRGQRTLRHLVGIIFSIVADHDLSRLGRLDRLRDLRPLRPVTRIVWEKARANDDTKRKASSEEH